MYETITNDNVMMFAIKHYDNPQCESEEEFQDDLKRFKYLKRLFKKYNETGNLKERLILYMKKQLVLPVHLFSE